MKLRQLQYVMEGARNGLNVTSAAEKLVTSQPGISKQIRLLEDELGIRIFERSGKHLTKITPAGEEVLVHIERVLGEVVNINRVAANHNDPSRGILTIATTHTQARYALPHVITKFRERYPEVRLNIHQGSPTQIAEMTTSGEADLAIATEALDLFRDLALLPCYRWNRSVLVQPDHPLLKMNPLTLAAIADYPIVTYVFGLAGRSRMNQAFREKDLHPNVVLTALDTDVIKEYVRCGLGIGIVASMAYDPDVDSDLRVIDAAHLFTPSTTSVACRVNCVLRDYTYDFIHMFSPHLPKEVVDRAIYESSWKERSELYESLLQPLYPA